MAKAGTALLATNTTIKAATTKTKIILLILTADQIAKNYAGLRIRIWLQKGFTRYLG
jgi:hypothetical protein